MAGRVTILVELIVAVGQFYVPNAPLAPRVAVAALMLLLAYYTWLGDRVSHFERWKWAADWRGLPQPSGKWSCSARGWR